MIRTLDLRREYRMGESVVAALDGVDLQIHEGEFVGITGASGSGKSTLMHIFGLLDRPTSGLLEFEGADVSHMSEKHLADLRNRRIGFVFQTFNLINRTSALDNVVVPLMYTRKAYSRSAAKKALDRVGLGSRARHRPSEMSGGECQRVAIARSIVNNPRLILADEPTGNLDSRTGAQIMNIFHELHAEGITIVLVTHELDVAVQAQRIIQMRDGKIRNDAAVNARNRDDVLRSSSDAHRRVFEGEKSLHDDSEGATPNPPTVVHHEPR